MSYQCPKCRGMNLNVTITTQAKLIQYEGNFETEADGDHEWDDTNNMTCGDCSHCDAAAAFQTKEPA